MSPSCKTIYEDYVYNTWPQKCSNKIPSILYGETNNVIDESVQKKQVKPPDLNEIEEVLKDIKETTSKVKTTDISEFRQNFDDLFDSGKSFMKNLID